MSHPDHTHDEGHCHHKNVLAFDKAFLVAIIANGLFVLLQLVFALFSHSTSLLADAFHNLGDVLGLTLAWVATLLMKRAPTEKATYGLKKSSILSALANGLLLVFSCGIIAAEAVSKLFHPIEVHALSVMVVAGVGIIVNFATALLFFRGSDDLNIRGAYLHLFYDALISLGVVVSSALLYWTGWLWIDPIAGLLIAGIILRGTWSLFISSLKLLIDGVPASISWSAVKHFLLAKPGVESFHDLHIWALSTQENALSVHLYMPDAILSDALRAEWVRQLKNEFNIQHVTIQVEHSPHECHDTCHSSDLLQ